MARYTLTIGDIAETYNIFDFDYTAPEGFTKEQLEEAFMAKYSYREIAFETYEQWKLKFVYAWRQALIKYDYLFNYTVDLLTTYKNKHKGSATNKGTTENESRDMPTPVSTQIGDDFIPSSYGINKNETESESEIDTETTRQNKSDVAMIKEYVAQYKTTMDLFLNEFNSLMFMRY